MGNTKSETPDASKERFEGMGKLGKEVKGAVINMTAKGKGSSSKKGKKSSSLGADKA
jgi:hypothetical protein